MTDEEIRQAWHLVQRFGPSNAWTGTNGPLAAALGRALKEIQRLKSQQITQPCVVAACSTERNRHEV